MMSPRGHTHKQLFYFICLKQKSAVLFLIYFTVFYVLFPLISQTEFMNSFKQSVKRFNLFLKETRHNESGENRKNSNFRIYFKQVEIFSHSRILRE